MNWILSVVRWLFVQMTDANSVLICLFSSGFNVPYLQKPPEHILRVRPFNCFSAILSAWCIITVLFPNETTETAGRNTNSSQDKHTKYFKWKGFHDKYNIFLLFKHPLTLPSLISGTNYWYDTNSFKDLVQHVVKPTLQYSNNKPTDRMLKNILYNTSSQILWVELPGSRPVSGLNNHC